MRQAWDSGNIRVLTKNKAARATNAHVSILGHITREELLKYMNATEQANGFANRILWVAVRRSKLLPDGGELHLLHLDSLRGRFLSAVNFARRVGELRRSAAARDRWHAVYGQLAGDRLGLFGAVTSRAEAQTLRLSMIYALLDESAIIEEAHLNAALAVWSYGEASARLTFGDRIGDITADELLRALRSCPEGLTRTDINNHFGRNKSASEIARALSVLTQGGRVRVEREDTKGKRAERWFAATPSTK
jgi:hypothetical protein